MIKSRELLLTRNSGIEAFDKGGERKGALGVSSELEEF